MNGLAYAALAGWIALAGILLFLGGGATALYSRSVYHPSKARWHLGAAMMMAGVLVYGVSQQIRADNSIALLHVSLVQIVVLIGFSATIGARAARWMDVRRAARLGGNA